MREDGRRSERAWLRDRGGQWRGGGVKRGRLRNRGRPKQQPSAGVNSSVSSFGAF